MSKTPELEPFLHKPNSVRSWLKRPVMTTTSHLLVFALTSLLWFAIILFDRLSSSYISQLPVQHSKQMTNNETAFVPPIPILANSMTTHCGTSVAAAKARGCRYDILSKVWTPSRCFDQASIAEYQAWDEDGRSWLAYADAEHTQPLGIDETGSIAGGTYYTTEHDHIVHCAMLWKKQFRALSEGRRELDALIVDPHHTDHCVKYLVQMTEA
ncbi:hypothetical protein AN0021.2 [Aspergillus nidulans FGSC A4]|nr:hypothetical protein AN0021.2 [Aspergillus nidulans FGSC A4]|eukprot:XP_657625.1 hypothetical protein AN0021.2 [Aspergillus nidulans FGSC A4]